MFETLSPQAQLRRDCVEKALYSMPQGTKSEKILEYADALMNFIQSSDHEDDKGQDTVGESNEYNDAALSLGSQLRSLLNSYSAESVSGTPDYVLADYLLGCLQNFNDAVWRRASFRGENVDFAPEVKGDAREGN